MTKKKNYSYDPYCRALAEHFLHDEPCRNNPELYEMYCQELAQSIQDCVERWFFINDDIVVEPT